MHSSLSSTAIKIQPLAQFKNVDEIEVTRIVGELGIGPKLINSWVTEKNNNLYVAIEMEYLPGNPIKDFIGIGEKDKGRAELSALQRLFSRKDNGDTYFFDRLFTMFRMLAEKNVSYTDAHYGNFIVPRVSWEELKIIDFDLAVIHASPKDAAMATLRAPYVNVWVEMFENKIPKIYQGKVASEALDALRSMAHGLN